ncbi:MAG: hypothetical protein NC206_08620 [Bacteroides sp.]|nr:hypothetical protein [Roseburia sp.]MCM1347133.1 hypothetical protein [Bacteroides sp.]MCM1421630.1 hypothetical protein [Bacteroides sp.]
MIKSNVRYYIFGCGILFLLSAVSAYSQIAYTPEAKSEDAQKIRAYIRHAMLFNLDTPHEKVYLHFDNTGYFKGERIWFKAYVVRTDTGMPTDISGVLYVELVTPSGDVVETKKLHIENGMAYGDLWLDKIFCTGFYEVRAYTRYMTNWGNSDVFSRVFPVFNAPDTDGDYSRMTIDKVSYKNRLPNMRTEDSPFDSGKRQRELYDDSLSKNVHVSFFPEGGRLVRGKITRVAYTVCDGSGAYTTSSGFLTNQAGDTLCLIQTDDHGRGIFEVVPDGSPLYLVTYTRKGKQKRVRLPEAEAEGCILSVDATDSTWVTAAFSSTEGMRGRLLGYAILHNGSVVRCDTLTADSQTTKRFMRSKLPAGVNSMILFDCGGNIHAERMFFVCPELRRDVSIMADTTASLEPCGKVRLALETRPNTSLSLSAVDIAAMSGGKSGNALTWVLLSSEVKGYVDNPGYYFESDDMEHRKAADLLMMVQGWKRHEWKWVFGIGSPQRLQPIEDGLYLSGRIDRGKRPTAGIPLSAYLYNRQGQVLKGHTATDSVGGYAFKLPDISGDWALQILPDKKKYKKIRNISIDRRLSPPMRLILPDETRRLPKPQPNISFASVMTQEEDALQPASRYERTLPTVNVRSKRRYADNSSSWHNENMARYWSNIYYDCDEETDRILDEGESIPTIFEFLARKNPLFDTPECVGLPYYLGFSMTVSDVGGRDVGTYNFSGSMTYRKKGITWYVDNEYAAYSDSRSFVCSLGTFPFPVFLDEAKSIYIADSKASMENAPDVAGTARIYIYTHSSSVPNAPKGVRRTRFQGFDEPTTFHMEDYSVLPASDDFRRTIYWNPDVRTDKDGKATVEFYNNSTCTQMYISAEGMTRGGQFVTNE